MTSPKEAPAPASNFLRQIIERDLAEGTYAVRRFAGTPGDAAHHAAAPIDPARIRTRFPPEPNGYLHIGHAKSICLNFGLANDYGGICHLRFDDTNPEKEEQEYVDAIVDAVHWLGFDWIAPEPALGGAPTGHLYFASDYFDFMYRAAEALVGAGLAYVDEQSAEEMRASRGDFATPGRASVYRSRTPEENLIRLRQMKNGELADGAAVLRAKIDLASPNINLRDPALYRIKRATHHNTGDAWCIYPMYTYAHPIEDALENVTHSICTLEFEDQRPFYDWLLDTLANLGLLAQPRPHQYEFARLNVTYVITSKRKLRQLVDEGIVDGWDDPRMPTIAGLRRRGYTPESIRVMCERAGTSKAGGWTDYASLEIALRDDLEAKAPRAMAVLDPIRLVLTNWAEIFGSIAHREPCHAPAHPQRPELGVREFSLGPELWIERDDFAEVPAKGFFRLYPGNRVRLKYGYVVECTGCEKDANGVVTRRARHRRRRHAQRHAGRRRGQGQGHAHLARRRRRAACRSAPLRPPVQRAASRRRRQGLQGEPACRQQEGRRRLRRALAGDGAARRSLPVRASRLLRRRHRRPRSGAAGVQPDRDAARHLVVALRPAGANA